MHRCRRRAGAGNRGTRRHTLLRARAIETGCFVFAAAQAGLHENKRETFGHSLIIDPWGVVLATAADGEGFCMAHLNAETMLRSRSQIPCARHRRRDVL